MTESYVVAEHLGKSVEGRRVLDDVSFDVVPGDVIGVLGKNGAGKTTLLDLMLGFSPPSAGRVRVFGHDPFRLPGSAKVRVGFVPQQDELVDALTVADQIAMIASFYRHWDRALIDRLVERWGIERRARIRSLSAGQRQKVSILLALGHTPDLLMLDEPVASLDPIARRQFLEQIVEVAADERRAVVFSSHIVSDIERLANKIWILKDGKLHWRGDFDALKESIVRVHLRGRRPLPATLAIPQAFSIERAELAVTAVVRDWSDATQAELADHARTAAQADVDLEVEPLTLEEIFVELHR